MISIILSKILCNQIKNLSKDNLTLLFNWFKMGDGKTIGENNQSDVFSTSKKPLILFKRTILYSTFYILNPYIIEIKR